MRRNKGTKRIMAAVMAAAALSAGTYAFTATNTFTGTNKAGDGNNTISGYAISGVSYTPSTLNPTLLSSYSFTLDSSATTVYAKPVTTQATYDTCTSSNGTAWTCTATAGTTMLALDQLRVIAAQ